MEAGDDAKQPNPSTHQALCRAGEAYGPAMNLSAKHAMEGTSPSGQCVRSLDMGASQAFPGLATPAGAGYPEAMDAICPNTTPSAAYLAAEGFEAELETELTRRGHAVRWHGRLALSDAPPIHAAWALECWTAPVLLPAPSVKAAADALRAIQRNWALLPTLHHRRAALIEARLPPVKARALTFPEPAPTGHLGGWTMLDNGTLLASPTKTSPFVNGTPRFVEDREGPPSRAYLKLWEALTRLGRMPGPGEECLDLGASPGGWTWVLARLGAAVTAVDKSPLDPAIAAMPGVSWLGESAFGLEPRPVDWLLSDIICYPERLLGLVERWMAAGARNIVCTLKFQGETDHAVVERFAAIPGSSVFHAAQNKHELTFARLAPVEARLAPDEARLAPDKARPTPIEARLWPEGGEG